MSSSTSPSARSVALTPDVRASNDASDEATSSSACVRVRSASSTLLRRSFIRRRPIACGSVALSIPAWNSTTDSRSARACSAASRSAAMRLACTAIVTPNPMSAAAAVAAAPTPHLWRLTNFRARYVVDRGLASTGSFPRYRWMSAARSCGEP